MSSLPQKGKFDRNNRQTIHLPCPSFGNMCKHHHFRMYHDRNTGWGMQPKRTQRGIVQSILETSWMLISRLEFLWMKSYIDRQRTKRSRLLQNRNSVGDSKFNNTKPVEKIMWPSCEKKDFIRSNQNFLSRNFTVMGMETLNANFRLFHQTHGWTFSILNERSNLQASCSQRRRSR